MNTCQVQLTTSCVFKTSKHILTFNVTLWFDQPSHSERVSKVCRGTISGRGRAVWLTGLRNSGGEFVFYVTTTIILSDFQSKILICRQGTYLYRPRAGPQESGLWLSNLSSDHLVWCYTQQKLSLWRKERITGQDGGVLSPRTFGDPDRPRCNEYEKQNTSLKVCTPPNDVSAIKSRA